MRPLVIILSCEHFSNEIPPEWQKLFRGSGRLLASHRGWDPGAAEVALFLAKKLKAPLTHGKTSRLLVDLNRSLSSPDLFSVKTRDLSDREKKQILQKYREPYWEKVHSQVARELGKGHRVLHLSVHSFTPKLKNQVRTAEIGLLFDPARKNELQFCQAWQQELQSAIALEAATKWRVKLNYPYLGTGSGLIPELRKLHKKNYIGIEIEMNHKLLKAKKTQIQAQIQTRSSQSSRMQDLLGRTLLKLI